MIGSGRLSFLRTGHSHEDIDQLFGRVASFIKLKVRTALTSSDFVHALEEFTRQLDRPFEPQRFVVKLDSIRDWCLDIDQFNIQKYQQTLAGMFGGTPFS